jgi:hypothetical protein
MVEWQKGGMAKWYFTTYLIYPAIFMVHAAADDDNDDTDTFKSIIVLNDIFSFFACLQYIAAMSYLRQKVHLVYVLLFWDL